jgi:tetratricopeptide (TPR) repeat protein
VNVFYFRYSYVADHFQYLADIGIIALAVGSVTRATRPSVVRSAVAGLVIAAFGVLTWQRCEAFHDEETLWRDTLAENPGCWMAWNNLGLLREQAHDVDEAVACYERALQVKPDCADAHIDLGNLLSSGGHLQDAMGQYEEALRIEPGRADTHYDMGLAFDQAGRLRDAIAQYEDALRIRPNYAEAENNLGNALRQNGQDSDALPHFEAALKFAPEFPEAHNNLAVLLASQGRTAEAIAHYRNALEIQPDYIKALNNLAGLLATDDAIAPEERTAAVPLAERACQLTDYRQPVLLDTLASAYAAVGRFQEAIRIAQQAIVLANSSGQKTLAEDIEARIALYKANRPFHQGQTIVPP